MARTKSYVPAAPFSLCRGNFTPDFLQQEVYGKQFPGEDRDALKIRKNTEKKTLFRFPRLEKNDSDVTLYTSVAAFPDRGPVFRNSWPGSMCSEKAVFLDVELQFKQFWKAEKKK